ncbi:MAG: aminomethyl-transferring glycine dehydrogenase subunit GcvPA [Nitrospiria bacterium]
MEYIPNTRQDQEAMLATIGVSDIEALLAEIPREVRLHRALAIPDSLSELELRRRMSALAEENAHAEAYTLFLGGGAYDHYIPSVVSHLISRSEFYTSYTPYQAEMSQGLLQSIYEYQTLICEITGLNVANASMYDGASALAEAALMACRITKRNRLLISKTIHPHYRQVVRTYLGGLKSPLQEIPHHDGRTDLEALSKTLTSSASGGCAAILIQHPNFFGCLEEVQEIGRMAHAQGVLLVAMVDSLSLGLLSPPGEYGADIAVGEGQALGNAMSFGGPYLGFFATKKDYMRQMPGRIVGATLDKKGQRGYCLTLQAREQHIRRERATSNICTNQALMALAATVYLVTMGREGLREVGEQCLQKAHYAQKKICELPGFEPAYTTPFFKEFVVKTPVSPARINKKLLKSKIIGGLDLGQYDRKQKNQMLWCVTEKRTIDEIDRLAEVLSSL